MSELSGAQFSKILRQLANDQTVIPYCGPQPMYSGDSQMVTNNLALCDQAKFIRNHTQFLLKTILDRIADAIESE